MTTAYPEWPYDWQAADLALDPVAICKQGEYWLYRALNTRRTIAFVGSGVSAAYGRVTWPELALLHIDTVEKSLAEPAKTWKSQDRRIQLLESLRQLKKNGRKMSGDTIMLALHLCEQLWCLSPAGRQLDELAKAFDLDKLLDELCRHKVRQPDLGKALFRTWIKRETHDELPHLLRVLSGVDAKFTEHLTNAPKRSRMNWLKEALIKTRKLERSNVESPRDYALLFLRNAQPLTNAIFKLTEKARHIAHHGRRADDRTIHAALLKAASAVVEKLPRVEQTLAPVQYFAIGFCLDMLRMERRFRTAGRDNAYKKMAEDLFSSITISGSPDITANIRRSDLIPLDRDPIQRLASDLGVRRFATTNYDLEIERFFHDLGFRQPPGLMGDAQLHNSHELLGPRGGRTRDFVLNQETAVDLIDFATNDGAYSFELVHLHGRATDDEDIVVTERDYQAKYLSDHSAQVVFDEGREATFGGNPVLFVGLGMSEGDVLRPLREFVGGSLRRNRSLVALRPAEKDNAERNAFTMEQYTKYGAHVIHYGFEDNTDATSSERKEQSWLARMIAFIDKLQDHVDAVNAAFTADERIPQLTTKEDDLASFVLSNAVKFTSDSGHCDIAIEVSVVNAALALHKALTLLLQPGSSISTTGQEISRVVFRDILPPTYGRARASLQTAALSAKLEGIRKNWSSWWLKWQQAPADRTQFLRYRPIEKKSAQNSVEPARPSSGPIWTRHLIDKQFFDRLADGSESDHPPAHLIALAQFWNSHAPAGRRCLVVSGARGAGKGNLYTYLANTYEISTRYRVDYIAQFFTSFSFTCEVASVWDTLPLFLLDPKRFASFRSDETALKQFKTMSRIEWLSYALKHFEKKWKGSGRRVLVAFNAFELLFNSDGAPKQGEIRDYFKTLLDTDLSDPPIDYLFIVRDSNLPRYFRIAPDVDDGVRRLFCPLTPVLSETQRIAPASERAVAMLNRAHAWVDEDRPALESTDRLIELADRTPPPKQSFIYPMDSFAFQSLIEPDYPRQLDPAIAKVGTILIDGGLEHFFRTVVRSNRFLMTLVLFIVRDIMDRISRDEASQEEVRRFFNTLDVLPKGSVPAPTDPFFEAIFQYWFTTAHGADPFDDPVLQEELVRHLAVIGTPVDAKTLAACPRIHDRIRNLRTVDPGKEIDKILKRMVGRGLVLPIKPLNQRHKDGEELPHRYQVHRSIQTHIYRRLGSQETEPPEGYIFGPSLFAAQTRGNPRLHAAAYAFLYELVDGLIRYPSTEFATFASDGKDDDAWVHYGRRLRAALGVTRTLFSIATVMRFPDVERLPVRLPPHLGYLEHHRLAIRWMLSLASWIESRRRDAEKRKEPRAEEWPPFYRDETVWLYNECALFSLARGECFDARALFDAALSLQLEIDGPGGGPMRRRILLNAAILDLDRGRLDAARRALEEVETDNDPVIRNLAGGYLGVVHHVSGRLDGALERYNAAIKELTLSQHSRPLAIFHRYVGDLHRYTGNFSAARAEYQKAIRYAESGSNTDMIHYARIADAKAQIRGQWPAATVGSVHETIRHLQDAETYADRMDMPKLKSEVLLARGEIQISQGETTLAGQLITRGIRIANLHGLTLRRIDGLDLLSRVYLARGNIPAYERLNARTMRAARDAGYHLRAGTFPRAPDAPIQI